MPESIFNITLHDPSAEARDVSDIAGSRDAIFANTLKAASQLPVLENPQYQLRLGELGYEGPDRFSKQQEKQAIVGGGSLARRLRGTWELVDKQNGTVLDRKRATLANIPYLTDRGTFIFRGTDYILANQMRLRPGIFTRRKESGELESHVNVAKGFGHRYLLDPETGVFRAQFSQSRIPLLPILKALGASDKQLREAWGNDIYAANATQKEEAAVKKLAEKFSRGKPVEDTGAEIRRGYGEMELDPEVTSRTLGQPFDRVTPEAILAATKKLLHVHKGEAETDDRDAMAFQRMVTAEDIFPEQLRRGMGEARKAFWKASLTKNLDRIQPGMFDKAVRGALLSTGLGNCFDADTKVLTRRGFVTWPDVRDDDEFACRIAGKLTYRPAYRIFRQPYCGELLGCKTKTFSYLVTPNHRMWCKAKAQAAYREELAAAAHGKNRWFEILLPDTLEANDTNFTLPTAVHNRWDTTVDAISIDGDTWAEFLGWYIAEGWVSVWHSKHKSCSYRVCISQCRDANRPHYDDIVRVLSALPFRWHYNRHNKTFVISSKQLAVELMLYGDGCQYKRIPRYCFNWSKRRLQLLAHAYLCGDGNVHHGHVKAETVSSGLADDLVELFGRIGSVGRISQRFLSRKNKNWLDSFVISCGKRIVACAFSDTANTRNGRPIAYYRQQYDGIVYCASVPGQMLYVMRDGKPHWSLNSLEEVNPAELLDQHHRVTRRGVGGIESADSIPEDSRMVQPSQLGYVDIVHTPESDNIGVDSRISLNTKRGADGRVFSRYRDKHGRLKWLSAQDVADKTIAFPGQMAEGGTHVAALAKGHGQYVPREQVDYELHHMQDAFGPLMNLVPLKQASFPQRASMGARMITQALPMVQREAPLVQSGEAGTNRSYEEKYGERMGAVRSPVAGRVISSNPDQLEIQGADGQKHTVELYNNLAHNRKTPLHNEPSVKVGDEVQPGQLLATSNFTDKDGTMALGLNARTAFSSYRGQNFEDAIVVSEDFAKRARSEHMYQHTLDRDPDTQVNKRIFQGLFPAKYTKEQLKKYDDDGIILPGQKIESGEPVILAAKQRKTGPRLGRRQHSWGDASVYWEHEDGGEVTDVHKGKDGINVLVKTTQPLKEGDKLCYSPDTEALTATGWKSIGEITEQDAVASLTAEGLIEYLHPVAVQQFQHSGKMYSLETTQVSLCVTPNHHLYAQKIYAGYYTHNPYQLIEANKIFGKKYRLKRDGVWHGVNPEVVILPAVQVKAGQSGHGVRTIPAQHIPAPVYAMLLGAFLSEGNIFDSGASGRGFEITQIKPASRARLLATLDVIGIKYNANCKAGKIRIFGLQWFLHFRQFGKCWEKFIPPEVFNWDTQTLKILYEWLMWGDGCRNGSSHSYCTTSKQLADDMQRLVLHIGLSANIDIQPATTGMIKGKQYNFRQCYRLSVYRNKNNPEINHGHRKTQNGQCEQWVQMQTPVHCVTLPKNHVLYVRRNGKPVWCGNSGRYGNKGVVGKIIPTAQMPQDSEGRPFEILLNPLGIISRGNVSQALETWLGKIAEKTGQPYKLKDFDGIEDHRQFVDSELKAHGIPSHDTIYDPVDNRHIPGILTGNMFMMKLHHQAESKLSSRGVEEGYSAEEIPAKGGPEGAKRVGSLEGMALLSHSAFHNLHDVATVRGQKNEDYWRQVMSGRSPPTPKEPFVWRKFVAMLEGSGIRPVRRGNQLQVMSLTRDDVNKLVGDRLLRNSRTVDWKLDRLAGIPGGMWDERLTGGHGSEGRWAGIQLQEPMPSPLMEDPIRRILGLTEPQFRDVLAGKASLPGKDGKEHRGPKAIENALNALDLDKEIAQNETQMNGGRKTARETAIRKLQFLNAAKSLGQHPKDWIWDKVPVLPPAFRPISVMSHSKVPLVADPNHLYAELFDANQLWGEMQKKVAETPEERLATYDAMKAVVGLGDPIRPETRQQQVKGILQHVFGSGPKWSYLQRKLLGSSVDLVGRAVITPDPNMDIDHIGVPIEQAWTVYRPYIIRRLVRSGVPGMQAAKMTLDRVPKALDALQAEMQERPVLINRAPTLHRYGLMAFRPVLTHGSPIRFSPTVCKGFGADFDGDAVQLHTPADARAVKEAYDKLLPSKNLISVNDFRAHYTPSMEYQGGLYIASQRKSKNLPKIFQSKQAAIEAYRRGEIPADQQVVILP